MYISVVHLVFTYVYKYRKIVRLSRSRDYRHYLACVVCTMYIKCNVCPSIRQCAYNSRITDPIKMIIFFFSLLIILCYLTRLYYIFYDARSNEEFRLVQILCPGFSNSLGLNENSIMMTCLLYVLD